MLEWKRLDGCRRKIVFLNWCAATIGLIARKQSFLLFVYCISAEMKMCGGNVLPTDGVRCDIVNLSVQRMLQCECTWAMPWVYVLTNTTNFTQRERDIGDDHITHSNGKSHSIAAWQVKIRVQYCQTRLSIRHHVWLSHRFTKFT